MRAARGRDVAVMRLLFDRGADPNLATKNYMTALMSASGAAGGRNRAAEPQAVEAVKLCLERGADVRAFSNTGATALHTAVESGCRPTILAR